MNDLLKKVLPWIGAAASGNTPALLEMAATALSDVFGHPIEPSAAGIQAAINGATPEQLQAARAADQAFALKMQALGFQNASDINQTMQAESASEHWPSYSWRPFIGFSFGLNIILSSFLVVGVFTAQVFNAKGAAAAVVALPSALGALAAISAMAAPILGVASWFRGKMQADPTIPTINRG